jgi:D-alanyl-lipoteichoic acid acyltransferase DltB (MBOAT superfamily)
LGCVLVGSGWGSRGVPTGSLGRADGFAHYACPVILGGLPQRSIRLEDYNLVNYFSFVFFSPLYMAGPILDFDSFLTFSYQPQNKENSFFYFLRLLVAILLMELLTKNHIHKIQEQLQNLLSQTKEILKKKIFTPIKT